MGKSHPKIMAKNIIIILVLSGVLLAFLYFKLFKPAPYETTEIKMGNTAYTLEVAKSIAQLQKGLSKRTNLCSTCGMIFVFNYNAVQTFWMKDTLIPLDMIWVKDDGTIVSIQTASVEENPSKPQKVYQNSEPAKFVIELNANEAQKNNIKVGDKIQINL